MKRATFQPMPCPVAKALEHIGDGWSMLILRDAFYGLRRFDDFINSLGIASNTLTRRLNDLVAHELLERRPYQDNPPRHEYHLTAKGRDFFEFTIALQDWGARWMPWPRGPALVLRHEPCGRRLRSRLVCAGCGGEVDPREVTSHDGTGAPRGQRRGGQGKKPLVRRT